MSEEDDLKKKLGQAVVGRVYSPDIEDDLGRDVDSRVPNSDYNTEKAKQADAARRAEKLNKEQADFAQQRMELNKKEVKIVPTADKMTTGNDAKVMGRDIVKEQDTSREVQKILSGDERAKKIVESQVNKAILSGKEEGKSIQEIIKTLNLKDPHVKAAVTNFANNQQSILDKVADVANNGMPKRAYNAVSNAIGTAAKGSKKMFAALPGMLGNIPAAVATGAAAYHALRGDNAAANEVIRDNTISQGDYMKDQMYDSGLAPEELTMDEIKADSIRRLELKRKAAEALRNK